MSEVSEPAPAEDEIDIAGDWSFVANTGSDCTFSGNALLIPTEDKSRFSCELTAVQVCTTETWQVRQTCTASRVNNQVVIISKIEEFIQGESEFGYRPDNFKLTIKSADFMYGVLASWGLHTAEFHRADGTIS